ncbi:cuticle protein 21-like [Cydia strobilella]|uniref:cuticle protein 21-like n=1 Tax=Cydia strobilella TaxID=1100964 RepID=UPI003006E7B3
MLYPLILLATMALCSGDVSHLQYEHEYGPSTEPPPSRPYAFAYTAGRYPGHTDRHHAEVSDGSGVVRGTYSYVDPRNKVRKVDYVADKGGFHPILNDAPPDHPADTASVAQAKNRHYQLYAKIAQEHASYPHPAPASGLSLRGQSQATYSHPALSAASPRQSAAVASETLKHAELFRVIAEQHARIAAEREELQNEEDIRY